MTSQLMREVEKAPKITGTFKFGEATKDSDDDMPNNWRVTLRHQGRQYSCNFYGGSAVYEVDVADVVSSLILDTNLGDDTFEDFCANLGYDTDSRKAYASWEECRTQGRRVRVFLGDSFDRFANCEH